MATMAFNDGPSEAEMEAQLDREPDFGDFPRNPPALDGARDMSALIYLEEPHVVHNLRVRFKMRNIYTNVVNILIAINPYETVPIYGKDHISQYAGVKQALHHKLPPHVYAVSEAAYHNVINKGVSQSMIVCGESGSGKTESAKRLMEHLAFTTQDEKTRDDSTPSTHVIEQQVLAANPILESFGNAKTLMNNNSSRFGKFTKLLFSSQQNGGRIAGSLIETYLLEKSRVVRQDKDERNFHIFYQVVKGLDQDTRIKYQLISADTFHYLRQSGCTEVQGISDKGRFRELVQSLNLIGFSQETQEAMFRVVSGILHLGNVKFIPDPSGKTTDAAIAPPGDEKDDEKDQKRRRRRSSVVDVKSTKAHLDMAAELLGVNPAKLEQRLITRTIKARGEVIEKPLSPSDAEFNRDAMAKSLYNALFQWVVARINRELYSVSEDGEDISNLLWIGILDVFGFEQFEHNSFEQFCINFANERLQQYFNLHVIKSEQVEYTREGIFWKPIKVPDNQDTIDLIDGKPSGILSLLDSACLSKGTDEIFTSNLFNTHKEHPRLAQVSNIKSKTAKKGARQKRINGFSIQHYAGTVIYNASGFLAKNQDQTHEDTFHLFSASSVELVSNLLKTEHEQESRSKRLNSVSNVFSRHLAILMRQLQSTNPFFVRCINPNSKKKPGFFDTAYVENQLRCGGLIEALRILKLGYPTRATYEQIYARYGTILENTGSEINQRDFCEAILFAFDLNKDDYELGLTKVFFKPNKQEFMEKILNYAKPGQKLPPELVTKIRRHLIRKRIMRLVGFMKAYTRWMIRFKRIHAMYLMRRCTRVLAIANRSFIEPLRQRRRLMAVQTLQACIRTRTAQKRLSDYLDRKDSALFLFQWWQKAKLRLTLSDGLAARIEEKREALEREQREREAKEREERVQKLKEEAEARAAAGIYFPPDIPSKAYPASLTPIVEEVANWMAGTIGRSIEGDFFEVIRDGVLLCKLAAKLRPDIPVKVKENARPDTFLGRQNISGFITFLDKFGVPKPQRFLLPDLDKMQGPTSVLNCLLNVSYIAATTLDVEPCASVEAFILESQEDDSVRESAEKNGVVFLDKDGRSRQEIAEERRKAAEEAKRKEEEAEERRRKEEEDARLAKEKAAEEERKKKEEEEQKKKEEEEAERKRKEEEEAKKQAESQVVLKSPRGENDVVKEVITEEKLNDRLLPPPNFNPGRRRSQELNNAQFFYMSAAAELRRLEEAGEIDPEEWADVDLKALLRIVTDADVPWHQWNDWVKARLHAALTVSALTGTPGPEACVARNITPDNTIINPKTGKPIILGGGVETRERAATTTVPQPMYSQEQIQRMQYQQYVQTMQGGRRLPPHPGVRRGPMPPNFDPRVPPTLRRQASAPLGRRTPPPPPPGRPRSRGSSTMSSPGTTSPSGTSSPYAPMHVADMDPRQAQMLQQQRQRFSEYGARMSRGGPRPPGRFPPQYRPVYRDAQGRPTPPPQDEDCSIL